MDTIRRVDLMLHVLLLNNKTNFWHHFVRPFWNVVRLKVHIIRLKGTFRPFMVVGGVEE